MPKKKITLRPRGLAHPDLGELRAAFTTRNVSDETLTPNLRALRLAMTASDLLLSMGIPANSVVSRALDITEAYCDQPVNITISYNLLTLSQIRGIEDEPLTLIRPIPTRNINNMSIHAVQKLVFDIRTGKLDLAEAEARLDKILNYPANYPAWLPRLANTAIAPSIVFMYTTNWKLIALTAVAALFADNLVMALGRKLITPFFRQAAGALVVTLFAAFVAWLGRTHVDFFAGIDTTLVVVGGIFVLISGLAIVGAVQDALEEYYITAMARLMRATLMTTGIVIGILIGIYIAKKVGMGIFVSPNPLPLTLLHYQILGGALAAAAQALATQTRARAILWAGFVGGSSLALMYTSTRLGISIVPASGVAALYVGLVASLFSRLWGTPASGIIASGILPLVPGLSLFTGIMQLVSYPPSNAFFLHGVATLFTTIATALAIAAGASLGNLIGRPFHRQITHRRNLTPFADFTRLQIHIDSKASRLASFLPRRLIRRE